MAANYGSETIHWRSRDGIQRSFLVQDLEAVLLENIHSSRHGAEAWSQNRLISKRNNCFDYRKAGPIFSQILFLVWDFQFFLLGKRRMRRNNIHKHIQHAVDFLLIFFILRERKKTGKPKVPLVFSGERLCWSIILWYYLLYQGDHLIIANLGDSRAVLATTSEHGVLLPVQLTVDFKPNLPSELSVFLCWLPLRLVHVSRPLIPCLFDTEEAERIKQSGGKVFSLQDEPGVYRIWNPNGETPGFAVSRAFGDYCVKECGLISVPDVTCRKISSRDKFIILATDGVSIGSLYNKFLRNKRWNRVLA